jgi:hypothetical protein
VSPGHRRPLPAFRQRKDEDLSFIDRGAVDLRQLVTRLVEAGNFGRAAGCLGIGVSTVTPHIQQLEAGPPGLSIVDLKLSIQER